MSRKPKPSNVTQGAQRNQMSPLWFDFRCGMSAAELVQASTAAVARPTAAKFLESAVSRGVLERRKAGKTVRYYRTGTAPTATQTGAGLAPLRPLGRAFAGPAVIPVRSGGVVMPVNLHKAYLAG